MRGAILLFVACGASVLGYAAIFGLLLDRPLALAPLGRQIEARLRLGEAATAPKLIILAGSNGPYSHRCEVIGAMLGMACVNGGIAVGIGLDYLFAAGARCCGRAMSSTCRWRPRNISAAARRRGSGRTPRSCSATTGRRSPGCRPIAGPARCSPSMHAAP
jgi:hypothetical protein